ncbi:hypothetical protein [Arthrobacter woluwensis]|uniref:hypothetical protein n=1 Tax=Arthrobacter woluwensis TaxID=156980 RepID=UPI00381C0652
MEALLAGAILFAGIALIIWEFLPSTPKLQAALDRLGTPVETTEATTSRSLAFGAWLDRKFTITHVLRAPDRDLSVLGIPLHEHLAKKGIYGGAVLALFTLLTVTNLVQGRVTNLSLAGIPVAALAWILPDITVRRKATIARDDFRRAIGSFAELVAMEGYAGRHISEALQSAASVGRSWVFVRIRQELTRAQLSGQQAWVGLERLSTDITVPELGEIASILRMAGEREVTIFHDLRARGAALRTAQLSARKKGEAKTSNNLTLPLILMAGTVLAMMMTPAMFRLFTL